MTLGDVGRKKYFIGVLFHFGQKMRLCLWSMTFQTFCIFRTGYRLMMCHHEWLCVANYAAHGRVFPVE